MAEVGALNIDLTLMYAKFRDGMRAAGKALTQFEQTAKKVSKGIDDFGKNVATSLGAAFAADKIISFGKESILLAAKAEGITNAFKRLNDATLLNELRKATRGTVSDVELMRGAVQANNFQIPLNNLATLFKFASIRARETGESVDYLVNSIVMGIARKSPLILDNLGINIKRIQEEFAITGDFAQAATKIVNEELAKSGDIALGTADKIAQWGVSWERFSEETGKGLISTMDGLFDALKELGNIFKPITDLFHTSGEETHFWDKTLRFLTSSLEITIRLFTAAIKPLQWIFELIKSIVDVGFEKTITKIVDGFMAFINQGNKLGKILAALGLSFYVATDNVQATTESLLVIQKPLVLVEKAVEKTSDITTKSFKKIQEASGDLLMSWQKDFHDMSDMAGSGKRWAEYKKAIAETGGEISRITAVNDIWKAKLAETAHGINDAAKQFAYLQTKLPTAEKAGFVTPTGEKKQEEFLQPIQLEEEPDLEIYEIAIGKLFKSWLNGEELTKESWDRIKEHIGKKMEEIASYASEIWGAMDAIFQQMMTNQMITLDNRQKKEIEAIEKTGMAEEDKVMAIEKINEAYNKKRAELQKRAAKQQKAAAIIEASINVAVAISKALAQTGVLGIIASATIAALGAAQVATIAAQPIPEFAQGGLVYGDTIARMGEYANARTNPEVIAPLDKLQNMLAPEMEWKTMLRGEDIELILQRRNRYKTYQ